MELKPYQACKTAEAWSPVEVPSGSEEGRRYVVHVCPWGNSTENICECSGYFYRGQCKHQTQAMDLLCGWSELHEPKKFVQTPEQRDGKVCPRCGGPTAWQMEVDDE